MKLSSFFHRQSGADLQNQAITAISHLEELKQALENIRQTKLQRQVELWSILASSNDLEKEYRQVSADIATIIKKIAALEEHLKKLSLENYHCKQEGKCDVLKELLTVQDPAKDVVFEVPEIKY